METETPAPLSVRNGPNSRGTRPVSRLPLPGSIKKVVKRDLSNMEDKENEGVEPPSKRPKISTTTTKKVGPAKPSLTATSRKLAAKPPPSTAKVPVSSTAAKARGKTATAAKTAAKPPTNQSKARGSGNAGKATVKAGTGSSGSTAAAPSKAGDNAKQKRPAWDLKGRLQDMEIRMTNERKNSNNTIGSMTEQLQQFMERLTNLESVKAEQEGTIKIKQEETHVASQKILNLEQELETVRARYQAEADRYAALQREHTSLKSTHAMVESDLAASRSALSQLTADVSTLQCRYDATKIAKDEAMAESARKSEVIADLEATVQRHLATIAECEGRIRVDEMARRRLHNTIQELKGNIRVFCRVRPFLPGEGGHDEGRRGSSGSRGGKAEGKLEIEFPDKDEKKIALEYTSDQLTTTGGAASAKSYNFEFDRVFSHTSSQESVFDEISQLVQSALDGYNVCIFAYGQTGSGKTYTMEGPDEKRPLPLGEEPEVDSSGMIPRAVEQVFHSAMSLKEQGWEYKLEASFLEIYNETIRDLLSSSSSSQSHDIKLDPSYPGGVYVTNVTPTLVSSQAQVARLLEKAAQNRAVAATNCNERSSRSHSVFRLQLSGNNSITGETCKGTLNLVDLAGSERLTQSGSVGERLKETKNINKSLSNLGQVIMALANKDQHIPYRNSKLTYLLQNSLGGNSKTLMFVNMSPLPTSFQETLCSLRFATKVNQCNIGTARKAAK